MIGFVLLCASLLMFQRRMFTHSLLIFILLLTNGFQLITAKILLYGLPVEKTSDFALLYLIVIVVIKYRVLKKVFLVYPVFKWCIYILLFVFIDALYSLVILDYSLVNIIQVSRGYLFLLSFVMFFVVPLPHLKKVFHLLCGFTVLLSAVFLLQIITNTPILLAASGSEQIMSTKLSGSGYVRFYNSPIFIFPAFFYFLFVFKYKSIFKQGFILAILVLAIVGPAHRSAILGIVFVISIYALFKQDVSKRILYLAVFGLLFFVSSFLPIVGERLDEAFTDLQTTYASDLSLNNIDVQENTSTFRIGHFLERFTYIQDKPLGWLFGIGLISDNAKEALKLPFKFGLTSEVTGLVYQIDTADLIWSPLILTLGFLGTLLYVYGFGKLLIFFFKKIDHTKYAVCGFLLILYSFVVSVTSVMMLDLSFRVVILLIAVITCKIQSTRFIQSSNTV